MNELPGATINIIEVVNRTARSVEACAVGRLCSMFNVVGSWVRTAVIYFLKYQLWCSLPTVSSVTHLSSVWITTRCRFVSVRSVRLLVRAHAKKSTKQGKLSIDAIRVWVQLQQAGKCGTAVRSSTYSSSAC